MTKHYGTKQKQKQKPSENTIEFIVGHLLPALQCVSRAMEEDQQAALELMEHGWAVGKTKLD